MGYKAFIQLALIVISFVIIITYIRPTFDHISDVQDEVFQYSDAVAKASEFNQLLADLIATQNSFSPKDTEALNRFLPAEIDELQIMRDIAGITERLNDTTLTDISSTETIESSKPFSFEGTESETYALTHKDFAVSITSSYKDFKPFLERLESNAYILEVVGLSFTALDSEVNEFSAGRNDLYQFNLTLRAYALSATQTS